MKRSASGADGTGSIGPGSSNNSTSEGKRQRRLPKKPLSAYNIYFKEERPKLLQNHACGNVQEDFDENVEMAMKAGKKESEALFQAASRTIANRWKAMNGEEKTKYEKQAVEATVKYRADMKDYEEQVMRDALEDSRMAGRRGPASASAAVSHPPQYGAVGLGRDSIAQPQDSLEYGLSPFLPSVMDHTRSLGETMAFPGAANSFSTQGPHWLDTLYNPLATQFQFGRQTDQIYNHLSPTNLDLAERLAAASIQSSLLQQQQQQQQQEKQHLVQQLSRRMGIAAQLSQESLIRQQLQALEQQRNRLETLPLLSRIPPPTVLSADTSSLFRQGPQSNTAPSLAMPVPSFPEPSLSQNMPADTAAPVFQDSSSDVSPNMDLIRRVLELERLRRSSRDL